MPTRPSRDAVRELMEEALTQLGEVSAGKPLCRVSASGTTGQTIKYFEGRYSVLQELVRSEEEQWPGIAHNWKQAMVNHRERDAGESWLMYDSGAIDALLDLGLIATTENPGAASIARTLEQ